MAARVALRIGVAALLALLAGHGCMTARYPAPVSDRAHQPAARPAPAPVAGTPEADPRPEFYTVKRGDTLISIALDHGLDYKDLAQWNNVDNPNLIRVDQQLRLRAPVSTVIASPLMTAPKVEGRPVGSAPPGPANEAIKSQPKGLKLPYSEQALAQLSGPESTPPQAKPVAPPAAKPEAAAKADARPEEKPIASKDGDEKIAWGWPVAGKVLAGFNEAANMKGVDFAGKIGQPVLAAAPGQVIFSGDGPRGYGKLIVVKHNNAYISVYAHNSQLLVKEGQAVTKGQKIADMGASDSDQVKLHFEIRRFGKPIDPLKLLPDHPG